MHKVPFKPLALSAVFALSLTAGVGQARGDMNDGIVLKDVAVADSNYCHIKYMAFTDSSLKSGDLEFNPSDVVDFYGPCNFNPKSPEEVQKQQARLADRESNSGGGDSGGGSD